MILSTTSASQVTMITFVLRQVTPVHAPFRSSIVSNKKITNETINENWKLLDTYSSESVLKNASLAKKSLTVIQKRHF